MMRRQVSVVGSHAQAGGEVGEVVLVLLLDGLQCRNNARKLGRPALHCRAQAFHVCLHNVETGLHNSHELLWRRVRKRRRHFGQNFSAASSSGNSARFSPPAMAE